MSDKSTPRPPFSALFDSLKPRKASPPPASLPPDSEPVVHMPRPAPLPNIPDVSDPDEDGPTLHRLPRPPGVMREERRTEPERRPHDWPIRLASHLAEMRGEPPPAPAGLPAIPAIPALPAPPGWHTWGHAYWNLRTGRRLELRPSQAPQRKPRARMVSTLSPDEQVRSQLEANARLARIGAAHPYDLEAKMGAWAEALGLCGDCMRPRKLSADNAKDCDRCAHRHTLKDVPTVPPPSPPLPARDQLGRVSGVAAKRESDGFIEFDLTTP